MLNSYGHNLDPKAAVQVDPFTPPIFGMKMVGQSSSKIVSVIWSGLLCYLRPAHHSCQLFHL